MTKTASTQCDDLVAVRKAHIWLGFFLGIITPVVAVAATFYNMRSSLADRIASVQLDTANQFVKRDEFKAVQSKIDTLLNDTGELKGLMKAHMSQAHSR